MNRSEKPSARKGRAALFVAAGAVLLVVVGALGFAQRIASRTSAAAQARSATADAAAGRHSGSLFDTFDGDGLTPLMYAARDNDVKAIAGLIAAGAEVNRTDRRNGWTPLLHAIHTGAAEAAAALLAGGADPNFAPVAGVPPLFFAVQSGEVATVRTLLDAGADPRSTDRGGTNALLLAVEGGFLADIDRSSNLLGGCQDEIVRLLLERAPDLRLPDGFESRFAVGLARWHGCKETLTLLARRD